MQNVAIWAVAFTVAAPSVAAAQDEENELRAREVAINLIAFDQERPEKLFIRHDDRNAGVSLRIVEVPTGKTKKSWFVETVADERRKIKRYTKKRFPVEASVDQVEPKGRYTIIGAPDRLKKRYQIMALKDGRVGVLGIIPLEVTSEGEYTKGMLKEVVWAPGGKMVVCVLNQKANLDEGKYDVDTIHFFRFRPWKVKWVKPDEGQDGGTSSE